MAWHSAGTYRTGDGRGGGGRGQQRFAPLNSWPDNVNLDRARRLLWPIKQKYGKKISWGRPDDSRWQRRARNDGFQTHLASPAGRADVWEPTSTSTGERNNLDGTDKRYSGERDLANPFGATTMGLIYVNPEGPEGVPDPVKAAKDIRETFARMAMNDEETVALIAGGHTFGENSRRSSGKTTRRSRTRRLADREQGLGWTSAYASGIAGDAITSGLEVTWTSTPTKWSNDFLSTCSSTSGN